MLVFCMTHELVFWKFQGPKSNYLFQNNHVQLHRLWTGGHHTHRWKSIQCFCKGQDDRLCRPHMVSVTYSFFFFSYFKKKKKFLTHGPLTKSPWARSPVGCCLTIPEVDYTLKSYTQLIVFRSESLCSGG